MGKWWRGFGKLDFGGAAIVAACVVGRGFDMVGRMSRESRPPGFDMSYRPKARRSFGPPMVSWIFPTVYLVFAMAFVGIVISTDLNVSSGWIYRYFVEGDDRRIIGVHTIAVFVMIGGIASMLRTKMRGVVIYGDGIGFRDVGNWGWPTVRNYG